MNRPDADRYFDPDVETMPRAQIEKLQEARIRQLLPYAYHRSALVKSVWDDAGVKPDDIRSLADFHEKVPFITKDHIRQFRDTHGDPYGGMICVKPPHLRGVGFTTGTTGDPTPVPRGEYHLALAGLKRELWHIGMRANDYLAYALFTFREGLNADKWLDLGIRPITLQHLPSEMPYLVALSRKYRPTTMFLMTTPLVIALDQYQQATGDDLEEAFSSYKGVVFGGEALSPNLRALMASWGLEIFELSTCGDITTAMECKAHDGMHAWEDLALVEHVAPEGNGPVADGERGELVVTSLLDDVAPVIRYRTDDLVSFTRKPCLCGRTHGRFKPIGRKGDEMLIQERSILPIDLFPLMQRFAETRMGLFQLVRPRREMDVLTVRVGYDATALVGTTDGLRRHIAEVFSAALRVPVEIELILNEAILKGGPPNKIPRVVKP